MATFILRDMGTLGGSDTLPIAVNVHGQATGYSIDGAGNARAFRYDVRTRTLTDLGVLPGLKDSFCADINDQGQVVGWSDTTTPGSVVSRRATLWEADGTIRDLGIDGSETKALGINSAGHACGVQTIPNGGERATIWLPGQPPTSLATLGGSSSQGLAIDDLAHVGGTETDGSNALRGFLYDPKAPPGLKPLVLPGGALTLSARAAAATRTSVFPLASGTAFVAGMALPSPTATPDSARAFVW